MVARDLERRGITDRRVIEAMQQVPRERFVPGGQRNAAYTDSALPIDAGQTISQPYVVARMAEALELGPRDHVLEIGTGSGYAAAVLGEIANEVYTVERHRSLADAARRRLLRLGYDRVHVRWADGRRGLPQHAPFDAIAVAASSDQVPRALCEQLAPNGRLVIPLGAVERWQTLVRIRRVAGDCFEQENLDIVRFVPLIGEVA